MVKEKVASQINDLNNETGELGYKELCQYQDWGEKIDDAENGRGNYRVGNHEK